MTAALGFQAALSRSSFALKERAALSITIANDGADPAIVPHPLRGGGGALQLVLRPAGGAERRFSPGEVPPPPGVKQQVANLRVLAGAQETLSFDVAEVFEPLDPGAYEIAVELTWAAGETWLSPSLPFTILPAADTFLDVTPSEAASVGYQAVVWVAPDGGAGRLLRFDEGPYSPKIQGALPVVALPGGAEPALSTAPAGLPQMDRWIAWISGDALHVAYPTEEESGPVAPRAAPLPPGLTAARLVRPLIAEHAPDDPRPRCTAGLLVTGASGRTELLLADVDRDGGISYSNPVAFEDPVLAAWATAPSSWGRIFVVATASASGIRLVGVATAWGDSPGAPVELFTVPGDELLLGDVRADLEKRVWIGLLVRRRGAWARVSFSPPVQDPDEEVRTEDLQPGARAVPVRVRLDATGGLHTLFREGAALHYVAAGQAASSWSSVKRTSHEALLLRPKKAPLLVHQDADSGPSIDRIW